MSGSALTEEIKKIKAMCTGIASLLPKLSGEDLVKASNILKEYKDKLARLESK